MIVNSAREYRKWVKLQEDRPEVIEDFIGCSHDNNGQKIKGFFNLFHGMKPDIEKYLPSLLDIAEDNQAIYEFLQNAVDCGATHFWVFYNDQYFLAVNNGEKFSIEGVSSILNIAQSTKYTASSIGRLGIGFKLVHRLVGKGNGTHELVHSNKGPIMFSWDKQEQLKALMSSESISCEGLDDNPFLFKIAITNFPANVDEVVKDINYEDTVIFPASELEELQSYVSQCLSELYTDSPSSFNQGTLFFIKLGENKKLLLDEDLDTLKNGIEYSMNTLKQLDNITFNGETIYKKNLVLNDNSIKTNTELFSSIDPQYKEFDILYSFGYLPFDFTSKDYYQTAEQLRQSPNFYKYFPMGDEVDNMALFIHSDSFQIEANRRKLINHHTNQKLLPEIAGFIVNTLNQYKISNRSKYLQLYASLLLTDKPSSKEKGWMDEIFFNILFNTIKSCAPTTDGNETDLSNVKIKDVKVDIPLEKIGLLHIKWFYWYGDNHEEIIDAACSSEKLNLNKWNINQIIENCDLKLLNEWLASCEVDIYDSFIDEIKSTTTSNSVKQLLPQIKLFKVGNERKSRIEIVGDNDCLITTTKIEGIIPIIKKIGIKCTNETFENHKLVSLLSSQDEDTMFEIIKAKAEESANWAKLSSNDKLQLVSVLKELEKVGDVSIKKLKIFKNVLGNQCALENLATYKETVEAWQQPYVICKEENFSEIQKYLLNTETAFSDTIESHYSDIIENGTTIDELYSVYAKNQIQWKDDLTIKMINAYGCTEEVLSLIEKSPSKTAVDEFIKKLGTISLISTSSYSSSSFEYRCIQVAAKVESVSIRNIIKIDDTPLTSFTSSNDLLFKCKDSQGIEHLYHMKLSDILPDDTLCALYGKVSELFSSITNYKMIFTADSSNNNVVQSKLRVILLPENQLILPAQYIFIFFTRWQQNDQNLSNYWNTIIRFGQTKAQIGSFFAKVLNYAYTNKLSDVLIQYKDHYIWKTNAKGKYLFSDDYTLENERGFKEFEDWCGQDDQKKDLLRKLDIHFDDSTEIKRRKLFIENKLEEWDGEKFPVNFVAWVSSISKIEGENQKKLLIYLTNVFNNAYLKKIYKEEDYTDSEELDTTKYSEWKPTKSISIFTMDKEMPCRIYNKEQLLVGVNWGSYKYFDDTKHLYIKGTEESEIAGVLAQVYQDKIIPFDYKDYISVCFDSYEEQKAKDSEIARLRLLLDSLLNRHRKGDDENEGEKYREKERREYEQTIRDFLGGSFNLDQYNSYSEHIISSYRIISYLKGQGYEFASDFDQLEFVRAGVYKRIHLSNGKYVNPCSAKWGIWFVHPNAWRDITDLGNWACVCTGNNDYDFELVKSEEDLAKKAKLSGNVLVKLRPSGGYNITDVIRTVFPGEGNNDMDVHLMIKMHDTPNQELNSIFDKVFSVNSEDFTF